MLIIKNGHVVDPASGIDKICNLAIKNSKIFALCEILDEPEDVTILDATGLIVAPGLVDIHVHLRDPGYLYKEDIASGAAAAAAGGVTTVVCMPNTKPVIDNVDTVAYVLKQGENSVVNVLPYGAVTMGQKGEILTDAASLRNAGIVALSDDGQPVESAAVMRNAMKNARALDLVISSHCEDAEMVDNYAANEGEISKKLGIPGRPAIAEEIMVARDAMLAAETGARVHIAHVSTAGSVDIIRKSKRAGVRITAETCPQYFTLTEDALLMKGSLARVNPPLRTASDVAAIMEGLVDGTLDAIVTDHAPHAAEEKARSLVDAPSGMVGLETSLGLTVTYLYHTSKATISDIIRLMSVNPAMILGLSKGRIAVGDDADLVIFDPDEKWIVDPDHFQSKSHNSPFGGIELRGRVKYTIVGGNIVYKGE